MKFFFFFFVTLFVIKLEADAIEIDCEFHARHIHGYACYVQSFKLLSRDDRKITKVTGTHNYGKTHDDVKIFESNGHAFKYFPRNPGNFFKNLTKVAVLNSKIVKIEKKDLQNLGDQVTILFLSFNKLEVIEGHFADYLPNVQEIYMHDNPIHFVDQGAFENLPKLTLLDFNNNACHSGKTYHEGSAEVLSLIFQIQYKCTEKPDWYEKETTPTTTVKPNQDYEKCSSDLLSMTQKYQDLEKWEETHKNLKEKNSLLDRDLTEAKAEITLKDAKITEIEKQNGECLLEVEAEKVNFANKPCDEVKTNQLEALKAQNEEILLKLERISDKMAENEVKFDNINAKLNETKNDAKIDAVKSSLDLIEAKLATLNAKLNSIDLSGKVEIENVNATSNNVSNVERT